jgi:hypothetical protein
LTREALPCRVTLSFLISTWGTHSSGLTRQTRLILDDRKLRIRQTETTRPRKRRGVITRRTNLFPMLRRSNGKPEMKTPVILWLQIHAPQQVLEARITALTRTRRDYGRSRFALNVGMADLLQLLFGDRDRCVCAVRHHVDIVCLND